MSDTVRIGNEDYVTFKGLLAEAHKRGICEVGSTMLVGPPAMEAYALFRVTVKTEQGTFTAHGDATPQNVRFSDSFIRIAETRAMARAIRVATNSGRIAIDELDSGDEVPAPGQPPPQTGELPAELKDAKPIQTGQAQLDLNGGQDDTPGEWYLDETHRFRSRGKFDSDLTRARSLFVTVKACFAVEPKRDEAKMALAQLMKDRNLHLVKSFPKEGQEQIEELWEEIGLK